MFNVRIVSLGGVKKQKRVMSWCNHLSLYKYIEAFGFSTIYVL